MTSNFYESASLGIALGFAGSVFMLFLSFGIVILNANQMGLSLRPAIKYFVLTSLLVCLVLFFLYRHMSEAPLSEAEDLLSKPGTVVYLNGDRLDIRKELLDIFRERVYSKASGSHPEKYVDLKIMNGAHELDFRLGIDSLDDSFYWVYFPKYRWHSSLCYLNVNQKYMGKLK